MGDTSAYKYTFELAGLVFGTSDSTKVVIDTKTEKFTCTSLSALAIDATTGLSRSAEVLPLILMNIRPADAEAPIFNVQTPMSLVTGSGSEPHVLDQPIEFAGNSSPVLELKNFSTDKTYHIYVVMHGFREKK